MNANLPLKNCIYKLTSPSGKVYIGQTRNFNKRMACYKAHCGKGQTKICSAILKHGWSNFKKEVIDNYFGSDPEGLNALETYWICRFDSVKKGYNILPVGGSTTGHRHSEETKEKMRKAIRPGRPKGGVPWNKGLSTSKETREKQRLAKLGKPSPKKGKPSGHAAWNKGVPLTKEQKKIAGSAWRGKKMSEETRAKMVESQLARHAASTPERRKEIAAKALATKAAKKEALALTACS